MLAKDIARIFEEIAPLDSGIPGDQLGFIWGDPDAPVRGVACMWCVHTESIRTCAKYDLNLIICHEAIWLPGQNSPWYEGPDEGTIYSNQKRRERLEASGITVYRSHSNWDALPNDGISDSAVAALQIDGLKEIARQKFFSVQELPEPFSMQALRTAVEAGLGYTDCRIFGDPNLRIYRFAFLIGGFGENQLHMPQAAKEMGAEAVIIGEMSEFIVIACLEMGLPVIETLHSASEIPGIKRQVEVLAECFPDLPVQYIPSGALSFQP
jgi:putative NIF3 family GTP cyclohydrolase 1 type 2